MIKLSNIAYMSIKHSLHVCWPPTSRTSRHNGQYLLPAAATLLLSHNLCHTEQFLNGSGKLEIPQCTPNTVSSSIFPASCDVNITNSKMLLRGDVQWGHWSWSWAGVQARHGNNGPYLTCWHCLHFSSNICQFYREFHLECPAWPSSQEAENWATGQHKMAPR